MHNIVKTSVVLLSSVGAKIKASIFIVSFNFTYI